MPADGVRLAKITLSDGKLDRAPDNTVRDRAGTVVGGIVADDITGRSLALKCSAVGSSQWPKLSCSGAGDLSFLTGGPTPAERMRILTNGNIGIGTINPVTKLEVVGDWSGEEGSLRLTGDKPTIRLTGGDLSGNQSWILHLGSNGPGNLEFFRRTGPSSWNQVISMTPNGNVGIGTTSPGKILTVVKANDQTILGLSGAAGSHASIALGRTAAEGHLGIAAAGGHYATGARAGDLILRVDDSLQRLLLGAGLTETMIITPKLLHVNGTISCTGEIIPEGGKRGYVTDQFVNRLEEAVEEGDVVVIGENQTALYQGTGNIPIAEVDFAESAYDRRVCGIVCRVHGTPKQESGEEMSPRKTERTKKVQAAKRICPL